jgi:hypothetical protein
VVAFELGYAVQYQRSGAYFPGVEELEPLPADVVAFADVHEDGQTRLGVAGEQLSALPLPAASPPAEPAPVPGQVMHVHISW